MESEILNEFRKWIFIMFMNAQVAYDNMERWWYMYENCYNKKGETAMKTTTYNNNNNNDIKRELIL